MLQYSQTKEKLKTNTLHAGKKFFSERTTERMAKNLKMKSARAALDLSQDELAKKVNVTRQTISAVENGDYNPTINLCIAICKALGKTLDELFWQE